MPTELPSKTTRRQAPADSPESIERRLARLISHYLETRSPAIARSVVRHIELLCAHPGFEGGAGELCALLRLKTHWRWLAGDTAANPAGGRHV